LRLTPEDVRRREIIMSLMCNRRLNFAALSKTLALDFATTYAAELASLADLEADGLVSRDTSGGRAHPGAARRSCAVIAMRFDATLSNTAMQHSRTI